MQRRILIKLHWKRRPPYETLSYTDNLQHLIWRRLSKKRHPLHPLKNSGNTVSAERPPIPTGLPKKRRAERLSVRKFNDYCRFIASLKPSL